MVERGQRLRAYGHRVLNESPNSDATMEWLACEDFARSAPVGRLEHSWSLVAWWCSAVGNGCARARDRRRDDGGSHRVGRHLVSVVADAQADLHGLYAVRHRRNGD